MPLPALLHSACTTFHYTCFAEIRRLLDAALAAALVCGSHVQLMTGWCNANEEKLAGSADRGAASPCCQAIPTVRSQQHGHPRPNTQQAQRTLQTDTATAPPPNTQQAQRTLQTDTATATPSEHSQAQRTLQGSADTLKDFSLSRRHSEVAHDFRLPLWTALEMRKCSESPSEVL